MNEQIEIENSKMSIKSVIAIVIAFVIWAGTLAGIYFKMQSKVDEALKIGIEAKSKAESCNQQLVTIINNNVLVNYRLDEMAKNLEEISKSTNDIYKSVRNR